MKTVTPLILKVFAALGVLTALAAADVRAQAYFDLDPKADLGVFRPSTGVWYSLSSESQISSATVFGRADDQLAPADYDGDGLTDYAVWRAADGTWHIRLSGNGRTATVRWGAQIPVPFGVVTDHPVPADYDGDGRADIAVWRPVDGVWYVLPSSGGFATDRAEYFKWGKSGDIPVPADYDGDGRADFAVWRPAENRWYIFQSADGKWRSEVFGRVGYDVLVPADYTGDEKADPAVYRSGEWFIRDSATGEVYVFRFGLSTDWPVPADYDGDGRAELAVFRQGVWYVQEIVSGRTAVFHYGTAGDLPVTTAVVRGTLVGMP